MILHDLLDAAKFVAPIGAGVALLWLLGRDRDDDYSVGDYRPDPDAVRAVMCGIEVEDVRRRLRSSAVVHLDNRGATFTPHVLPLAPVPADARAPLFAETLFRTWHPESPGVAAARMLREIAAEEQAKTDDLIWTQAGIHPSGHAPRRDGTCWDDCPGCARDLTGAFPVVRAA